MQQRILSDTLFAVQGLSSELAERGAHEGWSSSTSGRENVSGSDRVARKPWSTCDTRRAARADMARKDPLGVRGKHNTTMNKLRHLLGDDRNAARLINTVPRLGYAFAGKIEYVDALEIIAPRSERSPAENVRNSVPRTAGREVYFAAGVIVLTVAGMLLGAAITLYF